MRFALILFFIFTLFATVTLILHHYLKHRPYIKYIPGVLLFLGSLYFFFSARNNVGTGFEDLALFLYSIFFFTGSISVSITAIIIDLFSNRRS